MTHWKQMTTQYRLQILLLMDCVFSTARQHDEATQHVIKEYFAHIFFNILINKLAQNIVNQ